MRNFLFSIIVPAVFFAVTAVGQGPETRISVKRPDFTGKWRAEVTLTTSSGYPRSFSEPGEIVTIRQHPTSIRFIVTGGTPAERNEMPAEEFILYLDGRADRYEDGIFKEPSTTSWQGGMLRSTFRNKANEIIGHMQYELSADGRSIKIYALTPDGLIEGGEKNISVLKKID